MKPRIVILLLLLVLLVGSVGATYAVSGGFSLDWWTAVVAPAREGITRSRELSASLLLGQARVRITA
jgi:hypothetical protein